MKRIYLTLKAFQIYKSRLRMVAKHRSMYAPEQSQITKFVENLPKEKKALLMSVTKALMEPGKGILAADDSISCIYSCLRAMGLSQTDSNRSRYLDVLLRAGKETRHFLCGLLVREEMSSLKYHRGRSLAFLLQEVNVLLGFRADKKYVTLPGTYGEWSTTGLDTLEEDCKRFKDRGASFVLWRALYKVSWCTPSMLSLTSNSAALAMFASRSQTAGLVPILSVELLPDGDYDQAHASCALNDVLVALVKSLQDYNVFMEGLIIRLTPSFPGQDCPTKCDLSRVVQSTLQVCNRTIPAAVAGIMLARRETLAESVEVLNSVNNFPMKKRLPISFCFSRVIHEDVIKMWAGQEANLEKAQEELLKRGKMCSLGCMGQIPDSNQSVFLSKISCSLQS